MSEPARQCPKCKGTARVRNSYPLKAGRIQHKMQCRCGFEWLNVSKGTMRGRPTKLQARADILKT